MKKGIESKFTRTATLDPRKKRAQQQKEEQEAQQKEEEEKARKKRESIATQNTDAVLNLPGIAHGVVPATQKARRLDR